ncbi:hypothetical protein LEP1GSC050_0170 [Leptospira broomii serovar Hurstbridge str. 5399]|uniref:Uncharacterized protein n=1 Tax=Leptospira broomii serovar Hurstbridge str. 5399 TaxID=1049789 RepID=T0F5I1_9LEPT|nr:hypothetical protein LEP1GSC050_0170 [Leptospira broomii serovar Hurstbridge str. 5399]
MPVWIPGSSEGAIELKEGFLKFHILKAGRNTILFPPSNNPAYMRLMANYRIHLK